MKKVITIVLTAIMMGIVSVGNTFAAHGWKGPMKVTSVVVHGSVYLIETNSSLNDCSQRGRFTIKKTTPMSGDIYYMSMVALLTKRNVYIYVDAAQGCSVDGMVSTLMLMK